MDKIFIDIYIGEKDKWNKMVAGMFSFLKFSRTIIILIITITIEILDFGFNSLAGIPVVIIHAGDDIRNPQNNCYLGDCIWQAKEYNDEVILIGDKSNEHYPHATHQFISDYFQEAKEFKKIYKHKSKNRYDYELFCFQRWFILKAFMEKNDIEECFYCDSDFMLYCDITKLSDQFRPFDVILNHIGSVASGHSSYINLKGINSICDFFSYYYKHFNQHDDIRDHISDMNILREFEYSTRSSDIVVLDINLSPALGIFDWNIRGPYAGYHNFFSMKGDLKNVGWIRNQPHVYNEEKKTWNRFNGLHFQGKSKQYMKNFRRKKLID